MEPEQLATIEELQARIDWDMDDGERRTADGALTDLSDDARAFGSELWLTRSGTPGKVRNLVLRAVARYMRNPDGYEQSRAGDETLQWGKQSGSGAEFTTHEQDMLKKHAGLNAGLISVPIVAWGPTKPGGPGYVPVEPIGLAKPFPMFPTTGTDW